MAENYDKSGGYGKRPIWQWVIIYLVVGLIVYGIIYYLFIAKKGGYSNNIPQQNTQQNSGQTNPY